MTPTRHLPPWNKVIRPHQDILEGNLEMSTYAADLGAVDRSDMDAPRVYREASEFFRTTYFTRRLRGLLTDVMNVIAGGSGDRVIQLRTPFGGGKTHALLALFHLMKSRSVIDPRYLENIADPGPGRVCVISGLDLDPIQPRETNDGLNLRTLWGEMAYRLGGQPLYELVREHDETWTAPGGNLLRELIGSTPTLLLLDEVLVYVERAGGGTGTDPKRRQVLVFLQSLTEVVRNIRHAAMVYSLQASAHEAAGDEALLTELDHLVTRIDAKREPVSDDEVMRVIQRRLFPTFGEDPEHEQVAREVARSYAIAFGKAREAFAQSDAERREAMAEAERFEERVVQSYPFHPSLLDLMYHRWGTLPSYQRTRGALQFLARAVHGLWEGARLPAPLIGLADIPLDDDHVRAAFFSQVGERERYSSVLSSDITGPDARSKEVDRRITADSSVFGQMRIGTGCATAVMLFSFGGRAEERGVAESELIQALVSPEVDRNVVTTALHDLREELLYLHHTGRRYRFETKANLNLMIAEESKKWESEDVLERVRKELERTLAGAAGRALLWPPDSSAIPDGEAIFRVAYLGPEWAEMEEREIVIGVSKLVDERGSSRREFRNAVALVIPNRETLERARVAARNLLAIESLQGVAKAGGVSIEKEQQAELDERRRGVAADLAGSVGRLYEDVYLPIPASDGDRPFGLEVIDLRGQLSGGMDLHGRVLEGLRKRVFPTVTPNRILTLTRLGHDRAFVEGPEIVRSFFSFLEFPKLTDESALAEGVGRGASSTFGYVAGARTEDGELVVPRADAVRFGTAVAPDEVDLGPGCYLLSPQLATKLKGAGDERELTDDASDLPFPSAGPGGSDQTTEPDRSEDGDTETVFRVAFSANAPQLFRIMPALQNLADRSSRFEIVVRVEAEGKEPFDKDWLRLAVREHLDEAGVRPTSEGDGPGLLG